MRHYVLTRSAFGPEVRRAENRRRLALLQGVCARAMAAQTNRDVSWIVLVDEHDPFLEERTAAILSSGLTCIIKPAGQMLRRGGADRPQSPVWGQSIEWTDGPILTTRLDDDDAFVPDALAWIRAAAEAVKPSSRIVWSLPAGWRVAGKLVERVTYPVPMFCTLQVPAVRRMVINDVPHLSAGRLAPIRVATNEPAWLWVRHDMTRSNTNMRPGFSIGGLGMEALTADLLGRFPIDWDLVQSLPQRGKVIPDKDRFEPREYYEGRLACRRMVRSGR
jgi:hypothetical protein